MWKARRTVPSTAATWWCTSLCTSWTCAAATPTAARRCLPDSWAHAARAAHEAWWAAWEPAYQHFREAVIKAERFGTDWPWLDAYGATAPAEFFAVACEAYFVNRERFALEFPGLVPVLDAFFRPGS